MKLESVTETVAGIYPRSKDEAIAYLESVFSTLPSSDDWEITIKRYHPVNVAGIVEFVRRVGEFEFNAEMFVYGNGSDSDLISSSISGSKIKDNNGTLRLSIHDSLAIDPKSIATDTLLTTVDLMFQRSIAELFQMMGFGEDGAREMVSMLMQTSRTKIKAVVLPYAHQSGDDRDLEIEALRTSLMAGQLEAVGIDNGTREANVPFIKYNRDMVAYARNMVFGHPKVLV